MPALISATGFCAGLYFFFSFEGDGGLPLLPFLEINCHLSRVFSDLFGCENPVPLGSGFFFLFFLNI